MYSVARSVLDHWGDLRISVYIDRKRASFVQTFFKMKIEEMFFKHAILKIFIKKMNLIIIIIKKKLVAKNLWPHYQ